VQLSAIHDEAFFHILVRKTGGAWDFSRDQLYLGVSTLAGGSRMSDQAPGLVFNQPMQFLLRIAAADDARWLVLSSYDQHTYRWGIQESIVPVRPEYARSDAGMFLPWKLLVNRAIEVPSTGQTFPFDEIEIGKLTRGTNDPALADPADLADWQYQGDTLEIRIPWMLIGFMDPTSHQVWNWPYLAHGMVPVTTDGIRIEPRLVTDGQEVSNDGPTAFYQWDQWELPKYRERLKRSYYMVAQAMIQCDQLQPPRPPIFVPALPPPILSSQISPAAMARAIQGMRTAAWRRAHPK
jgi:hypothetical protein